MFLRKRNPSLRYYPTYSDIMKESQNLKVQRVSQAEYLDRVDNQSNGICGGLSTTHIVSQLSAKDGVIINPFESEALLDRGYQLQYQTKYGMRLSSMQTFLQEAIDMDLPVKNTNKNVNVVRHDKFQYEKTEKSLKRKIEKTSQDKNSRGTYIGARVTRNPTNGNHISEDARHALSMTTQYHKGELHCTGMDSNFFFAHAKGKTACDKLAEKMSATLISYNATDIRHISVTLNRSI